MNKYETLTLKLKNREKIFGTTMQIITSPVVVEKMNVPELDFLLFDCEHGIFGFENTLPLLQICRLLGLPSFVRVRDSQYNLISKLIDLGADGIMLPRTESLEQIQEAIDSLKFYPLGRKGSGGYAQMRKGETFDSFQDDGRFFFPQIESPKGIELLPEMLEKYGKYIHAVMIGPYDLSVMSGTPNETRSDVMNKNIQKIFDISREYGKSCGIFCNDADDALYYRNMGANVLWTASDNQFYMRGFNETVSELNNIC